MGRPFCHSHGGNPQSKHHRDRIRRRDQQQAGLMQAHLQYAETCTMMEHDDEDIHDPHRRRQNRFGEQHQP